LSARNENAGPKARVSFVAKACALTDDLRRLHGGRRCDRCEQRERKGKTQQLCHLGIPSGSFSVFDIEMSRAGGLDAPARKFSAYTH
jgi:hypothetical protein